MIASNNICGTTIISKVQKFIIFYIPAIGKITYRRYNSTSCL